MSVLPFERKSKDSVLARASADRRRFRRVRVDQPGRLFVPAASHESPCKIVDFSLGGAAVEAQFIPDVGTSIVLYVEGFGRFEGVVTRRDGDGFGECFVSSARKRERTVELLTLFMNMSLVDESEVRRHARTPTKGFTHFTRSNGSMIKCEVVDFSNSGALLTTAVHPMTDEFVLIGKLVGRVVRHHAEGIAIEFVGLDGTNPTPNHLHADVSVPH